MNTAKSEILYHIWEHSSSKRPSILHQAQSGEQVLQTENTLSSTGILSVEAMLLLPKISGPKHIPEV